MLVQLFADAERVVQLLHQVGLLGGELVRMQGINGGEVTALHLVILTIDVAGALFVVYHTEHAAVGHLPLGAAGKYLGLGLKLQHGDGLVHLGGELLGLLVHRVAWQQLGLELQTGVVAIHVECKGGQGYQVNTVLLDGSQVGITQAQAQHVADTGIVTSRSTHPQHIVIAPLDIPRVVLAQGVHDDVGTRTTIVDVAKNMQLVDGQALDHITDGADKIISTTCRYDGVYNHAHVGGLIVVAQTLVQQLLDNVGKILWQRFAHLRAGVLTAHVAAHFYQLVDGNAVPVLYIFFLSLNQLQFLFGVVYQGAQLFLLALTDIVAKQLVYLTLDVTRGILQDMAESLALAVNIGQEVLGALRQRHDSLEVDNLG